MTSGASCSCCIMLRMSPQRCAERPGSRADLRAKPAARRTGLSEPFRRQGAGQFRSSLPAEGSSATPPFTGTEHIDAGAIRFVEYVGFDDFDPAGQNTRILEA